MSTDANVVPLFTDREAMNDAWHRYDTATLALHALYQDPTSTTEQRRELAEQVAQAESDFRRAFLRLDPTLRSA